MSLRKLLSFRLEHVLGKLKTPDSCMWRQSCGGRELMNNSHKSSKRDQLIEEYREFVEHVAGKLISSLNLPKKHFEDHVASGCLGLVEAAERYDDSMGTDFKHYAYFRIRGAIIDGIRRHSDLSSRAYHFTKTLKATQDLREDDFKQEREHDTASGLAKVLDYAAKGALAFRYSLEEVSEEVSSLHAESGNPEDILEQQDSNKRLRAALEVLDERERAIIESYYFKGQSFVEISAEQEGLSKSWISRLHSRALKKLQEHFMELDAND